MDCTTTQESGCNCQQGEVEEIELFGKKNILDRIIINQLSAICFVASMLLTLIICAVTYFRYVVQGNLYGYEEWVNLFAFWLYFMGAAAGAYNRTHVSADLVNAYMHDGIWKNLLIILRNAITVSVCLLFTWYGYYFFVLGYGGPLEGATVAKEDWQRLLYFWLYFSLTCTTAFYVVLFAIRLFKMHFYSSTFQERVGNCYSWVATIYRFLKERLPFSLPTFQPAIQEKLHHFFVSKTVQLLLVVGTIIVSIHLLYDIWFFFKFVVLPYTGVPKTGMGSRMTPAWRIGFWYSYLAVLVGLVLMSYYFSRDLLRSLVCTILEYTATENNGPIYRFVRKVFRFHTIARGRE